VKPPHFDTSSFKTNGGSEHSAPRTALAVAQQHSAIPRDDLLDTSLLDEVWDKLRRAKTGAEAVDEDRVNEAMYDVALGLRARCLGLSPADWADYVGCCLHHPLKELLHQDPFTLRAFTKPRGYTGDAKLLDYIYGREERWQIPATISPLGRAIFNYTTSAPASAGVLARREFVANLLDDLASAVHRPHVLSVAAGHLREAQLCAAVKRRKLGRFVALDADGRSLEEVGHCYGYYGIEVAPASFRQLIQGSVQLGQFDLIYSTGLFDYLPQRVAQQLTGAMFSMLRPGGRLAVANFLPGIRDVGYMEAYMDWKLIYRTRKEMLEVADRIPETDLHDVRLFSEENRNILFLLVTRR
jgi:hypothetical protein